MVEPNPNQEPNQENTNNEEQNRIQKEEEDYVINGFSRVKLAKLPKTFIEGNTNVKIAFVESHVNCRKYESKTGLTFEGCFKFDGARFKELKGIHLFFVKPIFKLFAQLVRQHIRTIIRYHINMILLHR